MSHGMVLRINMGGPYGPHAARAHNHGWILSDPPPANNTLAQLPPDFVFASRRSFLPLLVARGFDAALISEHNGARPFKEYQLNCSHCPVHTTMLSRGHGTLTRFTNIHNHNHLVPHRDKQRSRQNVSAMPYRGTTRQSPPVLAILSQELHVVEGLAPEKGSLISTERWFRCRSSSACDFAPEELAETRRSWLASVKSKSQPRRPHLLCLRSCTHTHPCRAAGRGPLSKLRIGSLLVSPVVALLTYLRNSIRTLGSLASIPGPSPASLRG